MKKIVLSLLLTLPIICHAEASMQDRAKEVSMHYTALPNQYDFDNALKEKISDKITRQYVMGSNSMLVKWTLKKGAVISLHFHANEQVTWITQGSVKVSSQGKEFIVKAGGVLIIPPYVPHEFYALEDTIDIDFFTPVRADWLSGETPAYIQKTPVKLPV
jgi:quercetin dioxygenase-like cupin family protein